MTDIKECQYVMMYYYNEIQNPYSFNTNNYLYFINNYLNIFVRNPPKFRLRQNFGGQFPDLP